MYYLTQKTQLTLDPSRKPGFVAGYASKFGGIDSYDDTIEPQAYDSVVKSGALPKMLFNHDAWSVPVGRWTSWKVDEVGLYVEGELNLELQQAQDIRKAIEFGSLDGLSVSIRMKAEDFYYDAADIRHIKNVQSMREISLCTFPADNNARIITFKTAEELADLKTVRDLEDYLRDAGVSARDAKALISTSKRILTDEAATAKAQRDAAEKAAEQQRKLDRVQQFFNQLKGN
jgi:hypothetical protein